MTIANFKIVKSMFDLVQRILILLHNYQNYRFSMMYVRRVSVILEATNLSKNEEFSHLFDLSCRDNCFQLNLCAFKEFPL